MQDFFGYAFFFSMFINILQLTFSIYMLQVYDKVLTSYNLSTLAVITLAAVICLVVLALLEWIRSRLLVRAGIAFDNMLSATVLGMNLRHAAAAPGGAASQGNLRDVQQLRNFLGGNAVFAFFDLPWMPIYFALIFVLHPALGWVAVGGRGHRLHPGRADRTPDPHPPGERHPPQCHGRRVHRRGPAQCQHRARHGHGGPCDRALAPPQ